MGAQASALKIRLVYCATFYSPFISILGLDLALFLPQFPKGFSYSWASAGSSQVTYANPEWQQTYVAQHMKEHCPKLVLDIVELIVLV